MSGAYSKGNKTLWRCLTPFLFAKLNFSPVLVICDTAWVVYRSFHTNAAARRWGYQGLKSDDLGRRCLSKEASEPGIDIFGTAMLCAPPNLG
jgi:hypothetical protein